MRFSAEEVRLLRALRHSARVCVANPWVALAGEELATAVHLNRQGLTYVGHGQARLTREGLAVVAAFDDTTDAC